MESIETIMWHKYTKILFFTSLLAFFSCSLPDENTDDYGDSDGGDVDNAKMLEYHPDGDYDTLTNAQKIAKDRRNHRKTPDVDGEKSENSTEVNVHSSSQEKNQGLKMNSEDSSSTTD